MLPSELMDWADRQTDRMFSRGMISSPNPMRVVVVRSPLIYHFGLKCLSQREGGVEKHVNEGGELMILKIVIIPEIIFLPQKKFFFYYVKS